MRTLKFLIVGVSSSLFLSACYRDHNYPLRGRGADVTETRAITGFNSIDLSVSANIEFTADSAYFFEITGQENILSALKSEVRGEVLKLFFNANVWDYHRVKIRIHAPYLSGLAISGSGQIVSTNTFVTNQFDVRVSGSGNVELVGMTANAVSADISGSGDISFGTGTCNTEQFTISGSGNIESGNFVCGTAFAKISGSGDMVLNLTDQLDANISGSGNIKYRGRPVINSKNSGSGRIIHID